MTSAYRRVLALPGAVAFSAAGVLARLPMSMMSLGIVLLVSARTGSYSTAGGVSAAWVGANAVAAVPLARLVDRRGQRRVLGPTVVLSVLALTLLMVAVERDWGFPWVHLCAALSGATLPNVGAAVRARWSHVIKDRRMLDTAFAVEAVNDELVFVVGPTLVTVLAASVHPVAGLVSAGTAALVGTLLFVAQRGTEPPTARSGPTGAVWSPEVRRPMPWAGLAPLVVGAVMLGTLFGGVEVATVAFADEQGHRPAAGVLLAIWALGSLLSGLVSGALTYRRSPAARYRLGATALAALLLPLPLVGSLPAMGVVLFLCGFAISPTMIAAVSWVEATVPSDRLNEGMAVFGTGLVAGVAPGAALVGIVVDTHGASPGYWVPAGAGAVAVLVAVATRRSGAGTHPGPTGRDAMPTAAVGARADVGSVPSPEAAPPGPGGHPDTIRPLGEHHHGQHAPPA